MTTEKIKGILSDPAMKVILDRGKPVDQAVEAVIEAWGYDLYNRNPGPAYTDDGIFQGTDLDLACFLYALWQRGAVIRLPYYKARRPKHVTPGEFRSQNTDRYGQIIGLSSNKDVFSFGVKIIDHSVMTTNEVGKPRTFLVVDVDGHWYDGWTCIYFMPTAKENDFLTSKGQWSGNSVVFKNFIHPNRYQSLYGSYYVIAKKLIERIELEGKHLFAEIKRLRGLGHKLPPKEKGDGYGPPKPPGPEKSIKVEALQAKVIVDSPYVGEFAPAEESDEGLKKANDRRNELIYTIGPRIRFLVRAAEYGFYKYGESGEKKPWWIKGIDWYDWKEKQTTWNRIDLSDEVSVCWRTRQKTETVAA